MTGRKIRQRSLQISKQNNKTIGGGRELPSRRFDGAALAVLVFIGAVMLYGLLSFQFFEDTPLLIETGLLCAAVPIVFFFARGHRTMGGSISSTNVSSIMSPRMSSDVSRGMSPGVSPDMSRGVSPIVPILAAYTCLMFVSFLYAYVPSMAYREIQKQVAAFAVFLIVYKLVSIDPRRTRAVFALLLILFSVHTFLSIETASTRVLLGGLIDALGAQSSYSAEIYGYWTGSRMMTLLNANVTAPLNLIGIFLARYLYTAWREIAPRKASLTLGAAALLAMGFVLCVSAGSVLAGGVALIVGVCFAPKGRRADALLFYGAVIAAGALLACAAYTFMGSGTPQDFIPVALAALCIPGGFALRRLIEALSESGRVRWKRLCAAGFAVVVVALIAAVFFLMPSNPDATSSVAKTPVVAAGETSETAAGETSGGTSVNAPETTEVEIAANASETAAVGTPETPEAAGGIVGTKRSTAAERLQFYGDALEIAGQAPLFGAGAGAFEAKVMQVQESYYETRYVHNHYLQTLVETGAAGLFLYVIFLVRLFLLLIRIRKSGAKSGAKTDADADTKSSGTKSSSMEPTREATALFTSLFPILTLVALHTAIDFEMSFEWFLIAFYMLAAVIAARSDLRLPGLAGRGGLTRVCRAVGSALLIFIPVLMLFMCAGTSAATASFDKLSEGENVSSDALSETVRRNIVLDAPHAADYKAAYVDNIFLLTGDSASAVEVALAARYAADLDAMSDRSVSACETLVGYYYAMGDTKKALRYAKKIAQVRPMDPETRAASQALCSEIEELSAAE